ncbi:gliding motility-associated C-terminal domain-containing protein [Solitalea lacus]|uniref:gliding motility-associated C-terminal domain-containing protein n=1 Tax=Solitalea lacus TaxID=2911172 RepID=UPI001EDA0B88|nr:gliding motility-associated C-terminal domain-containing protein [Solitalea lacus]UKJ09014.1 gliding motility-associated C-terminal domain-containing protein [Solitalea lacus]
MSHIEGVNGPRGAVMSLYITSDVSTSGTISIPGIGFSQSFSVTANSVTTVSIPTSAYIGNQQSILNLGIHVVSSQPVVVYAHIYAFVISGSTLVLPTNTLGRKYIVSSYLPNQYEGGSFSQFLVIATENNTTVRITPSAATSNGNASGVPFDIVMNQGDIYEVQSKGDLSGSLVESIDNGNGNDTDNCKRIAVFGGTTWSPLGCIQADTGDNLFQQMYPLNSWGKEFVTMPFKTRAGDFFRVYASESGTTVNIDGTNVVINSGDFYETSIISKPLHIIGNKPISVVQYSITQVCDGNLGDPEMIILNPVEQNLKRITMNSTSNYQISRNYVNVLIKSIAKDSFKINGQTPRSSFAPITGTNFSFLQEEISTGSFTLTADSGFNAIVYGFGDIESYGYSAGSNLEDLDKKIIVRQNNIPVTGACINEPLSFEVSLPYKPIRLVWNLGNGVIVADDNPTTLSTQQPFIYLFNGGSGGNITSYSQPGQYAVRVTSTQEGIQGCQAIDEMVYDLTIESIPDITAQTNTETCERDGVINLMRLLSTRPGPNHTFSGTGVKDSLFFPIQAGPGSHVIQLQYSSAGGICSKTLSFNINVKQSPIANAGEDISIDLGQSAQLMGSVSIDVTSYIWSPSASLSNPQSLNPIATPIENTSYILSGVASNGCTCSDTVIVRVFSDLKIPNVFSPNNDNVNDTWKIDGILNYPNATVQVYNRFGDEVFYSLGYGIPWDGRTKGQSLPAATYYYVIRPNNPRIQPIAGSVTILY